MESAVSKKSNIAVRSDNIIEARFSLTSRQNNILDMLFCEIEDDNEYQYTISVDKYKHLYKTDTSNIYRDLKKAVKSFEGKGFITFNDKKEEIFYVWFSKIHYIPKEGKIKVNIDPDLKKLLYEVKKKIYYNIEYTLNFSSVYSQRFYYYLKSFEDTGWRIDSIENLNRKLECPKTYKNFANFKKYVLDVAYSEINASSDILFKYELIRKGKKVTHLKYLIRNKNKLRQQEIAIDKEENNFTTKDIKEILQIDLTELEYQAIYTACLKGMQQNKITNMSPLEYITKLKPIVENWLSDKDEQNYTGAMIKALNENWSNKSTINKNLNNSTFNNFEQRTYNFDDLEKKLLGWQD